jgi:hypothetical protein
LQKERLGLIKTPHCGQAFADTRSLLSAVVDSGTWSLLGGVSLFELK